MSSATERYAALKTLAHQVESPAMFVDLEVFDANVKKVVATVKASNRKLRPATKSIRVPELLLRIQSLAHDVLSGFMCFSCREALFLYQEFGLNQLLIAYPTVQSEELAAAVEMQQSGGEITLMVDSLSQVAIVDKFFAKRNSVARVTVDVDVSLRYLNGKIHLGVRRSPLRTVEAVMQLIAEIEKHPHVKFVGIMGYEAQVAGLGDNNPFSGGFVNRIKHFIRMQSVKSIARMREAIHEQCEKHGIQLEFFNGGGTGSLNYTLNEPWLTEVTAGSGFLQSHLFDYYENWHANPALFFSLPIVRIPDPGIYTCKSGGFVASGEASIDKLPQPWLPARGKLIKTEGCGEVQTPVCYPQSVLLQINDPIFFRPAKAGEIAEHFNHYYFIEKNQIAGSYKTYRGLVQAFY